MVKHNFIHMTATTYHGEGTSRDNVLLHNGLPATRLGLDGGDIIETG